MAEIDKLICVRHGGNPIRTNNFYMASEMSIYRGIGYIPICKNCLYELINNYFDRYQDMRVSMYYMCRLIDIGFNSNLYESALEKGERDAKKVFQSYIVQYNSLGVTNNTQSSFDDGEHIDKNTKDEIVEEVIVKDTSPKGKRKKKDNDSFEITDDIINFWGKNLDEDEYLFLINEFHEYTSSYECDSPAMERLLQQAAYESLEIRRKRESRDSADKNLKNLQDLLGAANIKPVQETGADANDQVTFGTLIKKWENEEPIPDPLPEWKEKDIFQYVKVWFLGHLSKMIGLNNPFEDEYEEEVNKHTVATPFDEIEDGDK